MKLRWQSVHIWQIPCFLHLCKRRLRVVSVSADNDIYAIISCKKKSFVAAGCIDQAPIGYIPNYTHTPELP